ncbi:hypothetical protein EV421DRAFT_970410 [Armillaria borealis]|uniref:Terpenoid synthase n=1 Tax=Armillaria borealis TaxID=47425 RepID=A0AA39IBY4_9AGAR|nr:hypothetical protein EV421DRAFT_970410 [Armillaria borealis]
MTALILEIRSQSEPTHKVDKSAVFLRELSGILEAYTMLMFPKDLPYNLYIQALPLLRDFINFMNDIASFYKEECENEAHKLSLKLAESQRVTPSSTWWNVASRLTRGYFVSCHCTKECIPATKISQKVI